MDKSIRWAGRTDNFSTILVYDVLDVQSLGDIRLGNSFTTTLQFNSQRRGECCNQLCSRINNFRLNIGVTVFPRSYYAFANTRMPFESNLGDGTMNSCAASTSYRVVLYNSRSDRLKTVARVT